MDANFEHVGYRYRRDVEHDGEKRWRFTDNEMEVEALADRGWRVERLYRVVEDE